MTISLYVLDILTVTKSYTTPTIAIVLLFRLYSSRVPSGIVLLVQAEAPSE